MCQIKAKVSPGLIDSERVALINTVDGPTEVVGSSNRIKEDYVIASRIHVDEGAQKALMELPFETTSGAWRVWVNLSEMRAIK